MNCGNDPMTNMESLCSRFIFNLPIIGAIFRLWGLSSINSRNLSYLMKKQKVIGLLPGGFQQATLTTPKEYRIYIKNRYGFIKYALKYNYKIYPTLTFNEHKQFWTFDYFQWLRLQINKFKIPAVGFIGKWFLFLNPNFHMVTVVGRGINPSEFFQEQKKSREQREELSKRSNMEKNADKNDRKEEDKQVLLPVSDSESKIDIKNEDKQLIRNTIQKVHVKYIEEIERLYEKYRVLNGNVPLKIY